MKRQFILSLLIVCAQTLGLAQNRSFRSIEEMHRMHQNPKEYIAMLEDPQRDVWQKPHEVINAMGLKQGEVIADIGAGSGYFTFRLARHVGQGRVYAVDVNPEMILHLNQQVRNLGVTNVVTMLCAPEDPLLADASIDRFFICDTWHHIEGHPHYLALLKRMLKSGGQVVMIDFKKAETPVGPPMEMRIDRADLLKEMEKSGFQLEDEHNFLPYQYFLVFKLKP